MFSRRINFSGFLIGLLVFVLALSSGDASADQFRDMKFLADVFGVDLVEGKTIPKSDTPVFDDRDLTIARLESQIEVYKSMMPSTNKVTYEKEKINE